jgi:hypothetical protein
MEITDVGAELVTFYQVTRIEARIAAGLSI